jgi:O-antigen/teichoic acid export membrane protein
MTRSEIKPEDSPASGKRGFVRHHGSTLVGQGLILGLGVLTGILTARMLGPVGRGEYQAIIVWPTAIGYLLSFGLNQAIAFNVGRRAFTVSEVVTASTTISLVQGALAIAAGLIAVHLALAKYPPAVEHLGILFVLFTPVYMIGGYPANLAQGLQNLVQFNLIRVSAPLLYLAGLVALFAARRASLGGVLAAQVAGWTICLGLGLGWVLMSQRPRWQWNRAAVPRLLNYGYRSQATNLANYFNQRIDQLVLVFFVPPRQLGFYAVAVTLSTAVTVFPQAAGIVTFSRGSSQHRRDAVATIGESFRASLLWLMAACGLLYLLAPFLIHRVFGEAFDGSIAACRILLPGALMIGLNQVLYNGAGALGRPGIPSIAEGVSMAVTAIGLYLLVPRYGYIGAAIVSSVAYTVSFLVMLGLARGLLGIHLRPLLFGAPGRIEVSGS